MIRDDESWEAIATRVADGEDVAWDDVGDDDATARHLHWIEKIGSAYRESGRVDERSPVLADADGERPAPHFVWGPLDVFEAIGHGSSATVYRAFDRKLERTVALKLFDDARSGDEGLEARRLARVRHPNLLTVFDADVIDGCRGLWTESIVGMDLDDELRLRGCWSPEEAVDAGIALCQALEALHDAGLAHGDLTPRNVLRERGGRLVVVDLGASTDATNDLRGVGMLRTGTPFAMSPERLEGKPAEARDDLYSLGALLYRMLTDHHPLETETLESLRRLHREHGPQPVRTRRESIPEALAAVIDRALDRERARRFVSAAEMERELSAARPGASPSRRSRTAALGLVGLTVAAVLAIGVWWGGETPVPPAPTAPSLLASRGGVYGAVATMQEVRVGERLHLELELDASTWVYVLNEDARGDVHVLFPLSELDVSNPVAAGEQRLPGSIDGRSFGWQVTSAGGEEHVLVLRSATPVDELETVLALLPGASRDAATGPAVDLGDRLKQTLRGMAGLAPSEPNARAGALLEEIFAEHGLDARDDLDVDLLRFVSVR